MVQTLVDKASAAPGQRIDTAEDALVGQPLTGTPLASDEVGDKLTSLNQPFDLSGIDQKIQRMSTVEKTWDLPALPDDVKLDLAMQQGANHEDLTDFLYGLWHDVTQAVAPVNPLSAQAAGASTVKPLPIPDQASSQQPAGNVPFDSDPNSTDNEIRRYWAGWAGLRAPSVVDPNSVQDLKEQAIQRGLLPDPGPDGSVDGTWTPELRSIQAQMLNQDFNSRLGGNRPGALSMNDLASTIDKWLTPSGLLKAAMKFDILPNPKNIAHETQTWGDKWRTFIHDPNPLHLADALTGPIDDVVVPVVNDFLLLSGVSEAVMFARGAEVGVDGAEAARGLYGAASSFRNDTTIGRLAGLGREYDTTIGRLAGLGREYDPVAEAAKFSEPSMLSRVVGQLGTPGAWVGEKMQAWRDWSDMQLAKKALQTGMKLGVASNLEHLILPNEHGINVSSLGHTLNFDQYTQHVSANPITHGLQALMDNAFAPPTLYGEGAVSHTFAGITDAAKNKLLGVTTNQRLTAQIGDLLHSKIVEEAAQSDDPVIRDRLDQVTKAFQQGGPSKGIEAFYGSPETAGAVSSYLTAVAAISSDGAAKAADRLGGIAGKASDPAKWRQWSQFFRNKAVAQLSNIDESDMPMYASARAFTEAPGSKQRLALVRNYLDQSSTPEGLAEAQSWIQNHAELRNGYWNNLLDGVTESSLRNVIDEAWPTIGNWDKFTNANLELTAARANGLLGDETRLLPAQSQVGRNIVQHDVQLQGGSAGPRLIGQYPKSPEANLDMQLAPPHADDLTKRWVNPLASPIDPGTTRFTVAATDTPTKQDALALAHYSDWLLQRRKIATAFEGKSGANLVKNFVTPLQQKAADAGQALHDVRLRVMNSWVDDLANNAQISKGVAKDYAGLARWASENGISDMGELSQKLDQDIAAVSGSSVWSDKFGIGRNLSVDAGQPLLASQVRELRKSANWMAAEVDTTADPELAALGNRLGAQGYKLVHGVQFLTPQDIADLPGTFADVNERTLHRLTLGTFIDRQEPMAMKELRDRAVRSELSGQLTRAAAAGQFLTPGGEAITNAFRPDSPEVQDVIDNLINGVRNMKNIREQDVADAYQTRGFSGRLLARASNRGLPYSITDMTYKQVEGVIKPLYGENAVGPIYQALGDARKAGGFKLNGLTQIENNLRAHDNVGGILQVLGRTPIGQALKEYRESETLGGKAKAGAHALGQFITPKGYIGGTIGAGLAAANTNNNPQATLAGGLVGATAGPMVAAKGFSWLADKESAAIAAHPTWTRYTHIADGLAHLRDELRFHLNPFFDLRRYTKGFALAQMHDMPEGVDLPLNLTMKSFVKKYGEGTAAKMRGLFTDIGRGQYGGFNPDVVEDASKAWAQQGLLGYNPSEYMTAMFGHLVQQGVDPERAYSVAKDVYSYGTTGRSAAEQSVNFIFFPFSFEKKLMTTAGKFITSDLSRAQFLHDSMQSYQMLDQRYDLSNYWQEHLPMLNELQKVNAFANGLSPGELGGINRPLINTALGMLGKGAEEAPILNAFLPQGVNISNESDSAYLGDLMKRLLPVQNDMSHLLDDMVQQGHVMFSPSHLTSQAETQSGWTEAQTLKDEVDQAAIAGGHKQGIRAVMAATPGDSLYALKTKYEQDRLAIAQKFPAWQGSIDAAVSRRLANERELSQRMTGLEENIQNGKSTNPGDFALAQFYDYDKELRSQLTSHGVSIDDHPELVDGQLYQAMRSVAVELAQEDPAFLKDYQRFFARTYGPIQRTI